MISCPNRNSADWKALTDAIGEFEAMRDFMEYETIRSIEEVRESKPELFTNSPIKQTVIKPGVEELFESNPKLANAIYETLGFKKDNNLPASIASTLYELQPNITDKKIKTIYDNYIGLMNKHREGKGASFNNFKKLLDKYQVYKYKDTYIFGQYDINTGTFITRMNSSPTSKELLAEAIPNIVQKGIDFISLVPKDYADKLVRSGYVSSTSSFKYDFKGEIMDKFAVASNANVFKKIFNKDSQKVTSEEIINFNENIELKYTPVEIKEDLINQAGKDLSKILETYLNQFGIRVDDINVIKEKMDIDEVGFADLLSKIAYVKDKKDLPPIAGEFIAYMMQYNPLVKSIINDLIQTNAILIPKDSYTFNEQGNKVYNYKSLDKTEFFKYIGKLISEDLENKLEGNYNKSLIQKIKDLIKTFFDYITKTEVDRINANIGIISNNILQQNKKLITASLYKPGAFGQPTQQVDIETALKRDKFGASIIYSLAKEGFILTGSTALSEQGTILRPDENLLHDIDWVSPFNRKETEEKFLSVYPDAVKIRDIYGDGYITDSYLIAPDGYSVSNYKADNFNGKIVINSYDIVDKNGSVVGTYRLEKQENNNQMQEVVKGIEGKIIDFFSYENYSEFNENEAFSYTSKQGTVIKLTNWKDIFNAKLAFSRYKDIWDYNRFMPNQNINQITPQQKQQAQQLYSQYLDTKNRLYRSETSLRPDETKAPDWLKEQPEIIAQQEAQGRWFYKSLEEAQEHLKKFEGDKITYIDVNENIEQYNAKDNKFAGGYGREGREYFVSKELAKNRTELGSKQDIEGFKDFVENPTSNEKVSFYHGVTTAESFALDKSNSFSTEEQQVTRGNEIINKLIDRLTQNTGIKPVLLSQEDAYAMMREAGKAYNGQPGFFYNGIVYLVIDNLNTEIVFHEFAHPIVRAISNENPALFAKLYNELISTPEGIKIVEQLRKDNDLVEGTVAFMEEAIVMSLGVKADNLTSVAQESNLFSKVINSILYAIKQFLRKLFKGEKLRVENLSATTTLDQLADMLANKQFQIETEVVTNTDVAFYSNAYRQQIIDDLSSIEQKEINMLSKKFYDLAKTQNAFLYTKNYKEIRQVLKDQMERSDLSEILLSLKMFQTEGLKAFSSEEEEKKYMLAHAEGLLNSLLRFNVASKRIYDHFKEINRVLNSDDVKDRLDSQAALAKAFYLNRVIKDWNKFIVEAKEQLKENTDFKSGHPLFNLINEISDNIENSKKYTDKIYTTGVSDMLIDQLTPLAKKIDDHYERIIKRYEERGASQNVIDLYKKEYEIVRLTPDKIKQYLKGELGDVNSALNVYLEGFMHSQDPVILGFSSYVKNRFVEMSAIIQNNYNKFINDIEDLVKSAGYTTAYSRMHMGKDLLFLDTVEKDESGMATKTVYRYITPYKNFKADLKALEDKLEKAKENLNSSDSPERKLAYVNALADLSNFRERYMQREYTSVYYEADRLFADEVGREAYKRREDILSKIRGLNSNVTSPEEILENAETAKIYWREYKQLRSLYYPDGSPKPEDSLDYKVAVRLKEHYELRKKFRKWTPRKGAFENAYLAFIQSLEDAKIKKDSEEYIKKVNEWLKNNTVVKLNDAFYKEQSDIFTGLALLAKDDPNQKRIVEIHKEINDIISSYKDENRHPIGNEMPEPLLQKIKALEEEFESLKKTSEEELPGSLTRDQWDFYTKYQEMVRNYGLGIGNAPTPQNTETYMAIRNKLSKDGKLSDDDLEIITKRKALFARLNNLRKRVPTQNFIDTVNDFITSNPKTLKYIKKNLNQSQFSPSDIDRLYDPVHLPFLLSQSPEFAKWFRENHITKEYKKSDGDILVVHTPTRAWTYIDPKNKKYYEKTIITDENGNAIDSIPGVPNLNYWYSEVKDSYTDENGNEIKLKTERLNMLDAIRQGKDITEATVDMHGQWLPRFDAEDKTYINEKYENLKANSKAKFDLAMALLKKHLEFQEELPYNSRLDTEYPRYRKTQYEVISSRSIDDNIKENPVSQFFKNFKSFFAKSVDDVEDGFNTEERELFVKGDLFDDEFGRIPITGMYNLESDLVSMDMLTSMSRYMQSGVRQKTLLDMMPTARALQKLVSIPPYELKEDVTMVGKKLNWVNRVAASVMSPASGKGSNIRSEVINAFIEREFEGKLMSGYGQNNTFLNKFSNGLLSMSSKMFFAFNIPAALKNSFGARFQSMIEASGGEYFNWADYGRGTVWSNMVTAEISMQIYRFGEKSVNYQLVELMDPSQGRLKSKISEGAGISKSVASDVIDLSFMTNVRKWTELNSTLSVFGAMLTKELVEVKDSKGNVSKIKYSDAWEVKDGVIQLKEGVDPTYAPGGKNYTAFVKKVHGVVNRLNGAYDEFNQPLANRFLLYRMIMFLKKYFVEMFMNRWQARYRNGRLVPRYDGNLDTIAMGYYVQFFRAAARMFSVYKFNVKNMTEDEIIASKKTLTEMGLLAIISQLLISVIFGYDPDDEERYEKLRKKSGALPLPFVVEDPDNPFKGIGWFENHLLNLAIQVESENDSWLPWFGMGFDDYMGIIKMESVATSATLERWIDLFTRFSDYIDYLVTGDTSALYKRAVGPYSWQQEGSAKVLNPLMQTLSITGKVTQPIDAIKSLESRERR